MTVMSMPVRTFSVWDIKRSQEESPHFREGRMSIILFAGAGVFFLACLVSYALFMLPLYLQLRREVKKEKGV